jgi:hypothetical protein
VILCDSEVVGAGRLEPVPDGVEIGIWLGRRARGRGVGRAAVDLLVEQARTDGHRRLVASTTAANGAAVRLLDALGASLTTQDDAGRRRTTVCCPSDGGPVDRAAIGPAKPVSPAAGDAGGRGSGVSLTADGSPGPGVDSGHNPA